MTAGLSTLKKDFPLKSVRTQELTAMNRITVKQILGKHRVIREILSRVGREIGILLLVNYTNFKTNVN